MGNMAKATKKIKQNKTEQAIGILANNIDYTNQGLFRMSVRLDSLIGLLIDKGVITDEELKERIKVDFENIVKAQQSQEADGQTTLTMEEPEQK